MSTRAIGPVLDVRTLPTRASGATAPEWWGILALVVIEGIVFTGAIVSYFHLELRNAAWPPPGIEPSDLLLPSVNTALLVATAVPVWLAVKAFHHGRIRPAVWGLPVGVAMLVAFLAIKTWEYAHKPWGATTHAYGSIVLLMTGLHMVHVTAVVLKTVVIHAYIRSGRIEPDRPAPLEANALYWYFVILVWLPLYATIYLSPHVLP